MDLIKFLLTRGIWPFSFGLAALVFGGLLLFANELPSPMRRWTLPSFAVYLLGLGLLVFLKELFHLRYRADLEEGEHPNLSTGWVLFFVALHVLWFFALVAYNFWRGAL